MVLNLPKEQCGSHFRALCPPSVSFSVLSGALGTPAQLLPGLPAVRRELVATLRSREQVKVHI